MFPSNCWQASRNGSIRTAQPGAPFSQLPDNRIVLSERRRRLSRDEIFYREVRRRLPHCQEFQPIIGLRVSFRRTRHQQGDLAGDSIGFEPRLGETAPVLRTLDQLDRLDTVGKSQSLADGRVAAKGYNPL